MPIIGQKKRFTVKLHPWIGSGKKVRHKGDEGMLREQFRKLEEKLLDGICAFYGERLISIVLFGSVARETPNFYSDVDILIIAKDLPQGRIPRIREFEKIEEQIAPLLDSLRREGIQTEISAILKSPNEAEQGSPLFLDMVEDGRILFDRDGFFSALLRQLCNRLRILGARRIWRGDAWHWVLKPDFKPGEVFEI